MRRIFSGGFLCLFVGSKVWHRINGGTIAPFVQGKGISLHHEASWCIFVGFRCHALS
jgi:hypothetical protein